MGSGMALTQASVFSFKLKGGLKLRFSVVTLTLYAGSALLLKQIVPAAGASAGVKGRDLKFPEKFNLSEKKTEKNVFFWKNGKIWKNTKNELFSVSTVFGCFTL